MVEVSKGLQHFSFNNVLESHSCSFDYDLSECGHLQGRWTRYLRTYWEPQLTPWLRAVREHVRGPEEILLPANTVGGIGKKFGGAGGHRWGGCVLGLTLRWNPPQITLLSRAVRFPYHAALDLAFASKVAEALGQDFKFVWMAPNIYLSCLYALPYLHFREELQYYIEQDKRSGLKTYSKFLATHGEEARFAPAVRMLQRMKAERKPMWVKELPFEAV